jgi:hypothetical protein
LLHQAAWLAWNGVLVGLSGSQYRVSSGSWLLVPASLTTADDSGWQINGYYAFLAVTALLRYGALRGEYPQVANQRRIELYRVKRFHL